MQSEKQLYLCNSCKRTGIKSYKSKIFESFFCPRCKKNTTLFLPPSKIKEIEEKKILNTQPTEQEKKIEPEVVEKSQPRKSGFSLRDVVTFMLGFIAALLIMKQP